MRKCWQLFIVFLLSTFLVIVNESLAYAASNTPDKLDIQSLFQTLFNTINSNLIYVFFFCLIFLVIFFGLWARKDDMLLEHQVPSTFLLALLLFGICWSGSVFFSKDFIDYFKFAFAAVLGILGGYYSSLQSIKKSKVEMALEYVDKWDSSELQEPRKHILKRKKFPAIVQLDDHKQVSSKTSQSQQPGTSQNMEAKQSDSSHVSKTETSQYQQPSEPQNTETKQSVPVSETDLIGYLALHSEDNKCKKVETKSKCNKPKCNKPKCNMIEAIGKVIELDPELRFEIGVICNLWKKICILLDNEIADKKILAATFQSLYCQRYAILCIAFL